MTINERKHEMIVDELTYADSGNPCQYGPYICEGLDPGGAYARLSTGGTVHLSLLYPYVPDQPASPPSRVVSDGPLAGASGLGKAFKKKEGGSDSSEVLTSEELDRLLSDRPADDDGS